MNISDYFTNKFKLFKRPIKISMSKIVDLWLENKQHDVKKSTFEYYKRIGTNIFKKTGVNITLERFMMVLCRLL